MSDGLSQLVDRRKYEHSGVYSISALGHILYIGKSVNMRRRVMEHVRHIMSPEGSEDNRGIHKYFVLNELWNNGLEISFDVLYDGYDIDYMEAYYINKERPIFNMAIPQINNPQIVTKNWLAAEVTYQDILDGIYQYPEEEVLNFES